MDEQMVPPLTPAEVLSRLNPMPTDPSAPPLPTRTLADYRPQHDDDCDSQPFPLRYECGCWWKNSRSLHRVESCSDNAAQHFVKPYRGPQPCTCGLDALLAQSGALRVREEEGQGEQQKDQGAGLAAAGNDTGSSPTETASGVSVDEYLGVVADRQRFWNLVVEWCELKEYDAGLKYLQADAALDALLVKVYQLGRNRVLAGNQASTSGIASPAASSAQKSPSSQDPPGSDRDAGVKT